MPGMLRETLRMPNNIILLPVYLISFKTGITVVVATARQVSFLSFVMFVSGGSLKNTALIFLEIFGIECCTVLVEPPVTLSLPSFA